jgi:type IV pilus assembly protein PilM
MPLAIDIGTRALHAVQGSSSKNRIDIKKVVIEPLSSGLVQDGIIREYGGLEVALRNMLDKYGIRERSCCLTINGNHIYSRDLVVPKGKPKVMQDIVAFEVQSSMNATKAMSVEFVLSKQTVDKPDMVAVHASAMQLEYVNDYHKLLRNCRLSPTALDIHPNALTKVVNNREINDRPLREGISTLFLDLGGVTSSAYIYNKGEIIYSRIIPIGGVEIERYVTQTNEKEPADRQILIDRLDLSLDTIRRSPALADAARPFVTTVNEGVQRILQFLASRLQNERVSQVYLYGRTATYSGIDRTLGETLGIPTETIQKVSQINMPSGAPIAPFINAIGALQRMD